VDFPFQFSVFALIFERSIITLLHYVVTNILAVSEKFTKHEKVL